MQIFTRPERTRPRSDRPRRQGQRAGWAAVAALAVAAAGALVPVQGATAASTPTSYVALGDSYAAGQAVGGLTGTDPACLQSAQSYPRVAAARAGLTLKDATCSGATLSDLFTAKNGVPAQADALDWSTDVVTLTMGGNDLGFTSVIQSCLAASANGPLLTGEASCRAKYTVNGTDALSAKAADVVAPALGDAVTRIRAKAPNARVVVVGYPTLLPDAAHTPVGGCFSALNGSGSSLPFETADLAFINSVQATLDARSKTAAESAGAEYVSLTGNTFDHSVCSVTPFVNKLELSGFARQPASLHPNADGLAFAGSAVANVLAAPRAFQGVTGKLEPKGGTLYELQLDVPSETLFTTPEVTVQRNGGYVAHVAGQSAWYLGVRQSPSGRTYVTNLTVNAGDVVSLRTASGAVAVLTGSTFQGVTGSLVALGGNQYELQLRVPQANLLSTPEVTARVNGVYQAHVAGQNGWYLAVRSEGANRVYYRTVTVNPGDTVDLRTSAGETQLLRIPQP